MKLTYLHTQRYNIYSKRLIFSAVGAILWCIGSVKAQSPAHNNNWFFGHNAGLSFAGGLPQAQQGGQLYTQEGCASRSSESGQLLFYTDGSTIWNRNHQVMPGATGLGGSSYSTQSALIVPYQKSEAEFYVFSVAGQNESTGIQYALVNLNLNNGLGGLTYKNKTLVAPSTEKITTVVHCNNLNHWIITHDALSNAFRVYLLNDNGLILNPSVYTVGSTHVSLAGVGHPHRQSKGYMKPSHDGKKLAVAVSDSVEGGFLEVFDFDNKTGAVSNPVKLQTSQTAGAYGVEFSPDNSLIYLSSMSSKNIYQIRVSDLTITATLPVQSQRNSAPGIGALQIGPDNKIYGAQPGEGSLVVINQPNQPGAGCNLVSQGISLGGSIATAGLPFNVDTIPKLPPKVSIALTNLGGCNNFLLSSKTENLDPAYLTYQWYLNGVAVPDATSSTLKPTKSGLYLMKVREQKCDDLHITSTEQLPVELVEVEPTAALVPDSCGAFMLNAHATGGTVQWMGTGITAPRDRLDSLMVTGIIGTQTFTVRATSPTNASCFDQKTVTVNFTKPAPFQLPNPTRTVCGDSLPIQVSATTDWDSFRWQLPNGSMVNGTTLVAHENGVYRLKAFSTSTGCTSTDTLRVTLNPIPPLRLAQHRIDTCFTSINVLRLDAGALPDVAYTWLQDGTLAGTEQTLNATDYGVYTIRVRTAAGCQASDSLQIRSNCPITTPVAYVPDLFTPNQDGVNETLVIHSAATESMTLTIFNRWGELLYRATSETKSSAGWVTWDGMYKGQLVGSGLYLYRLDMKGSNYPDVVTMKGTIEVLR